MLVLALAFPAAVQAGAEDADARYQQRADLDEARAAAAIWQRALMADPANFEAASKLGRASYWLGGHLPTEEARAEAFETGMAAARKAIAARPERPEGYFWLAANMGGLAEIGGLRAGLRYRTPIRRNLEKVLAIDPAFQKGSADRALGRWYYKVPRLFGGNKRTSEEHLRKSLTYQPASIASRFFLAETLESMDRDEEAIALLREIETLPVDPEWAPEDREFKAKAREMLASFTM